MEYGQIVKKNPLYPMLFDSEGKVLSFPPIINSNDLGKITEESRNLLVEVTGTLHKTVLSTLNLVTSALIDTRRKSLLSNNPISKRLRVHRANGENPRFQKPMCR